MKDLLKLYSFESVHKSEDEKAIADWICKWLDAHNILGYKRDGNTIYRFNPDHDMILSAHLDQVKTNGKAVKFYQNDIGIIAGFNKNWERTSLGADDKNGIWIILKALENKCDVSFIISEGEETGCNGIKKLATSGVLDDNINKDNNYCLVLDRKGGGDILKSGAGVTFCSTLAQSICNFLKDKRYSVTSGSLSDTCTISKYCESVNMSVAYYEPHSSIESTDYKRLCEIKDDVIRLYKYFIHYPTDPDVYSTTFKSKTKGGFLYGQY